MKNKTKKPKPQTPNQMPVAKQAKYLRGKLSRLSVTFVSYRKLFGRIQSGLHWPFAAIGMIFFLAFTLLPEGRCLPGKVSHKIYLYAQITVHKLHSGRQMPQWLYKANLKFPRFTSHSQRNSNADGISCFTVVDAVPERISILNWQKLND